MAFLRADVGRRSGGMGTLRLLLDTHTFYWWIGGKSSLSANAHAAISNQQNEKYISAITIWEIITKFRSGKEPGFGAIAANVAGAVAAQGFTELAITAHHAEVSASLPYHHRDPMDRFLIAQAIVEGMTIATADSSFDSYPATLLW
jgi:PIN domain nuclease of toxin-antitoxin system